LNLRPLGYEEEPILYRKRKEPKIHDSRGLLSRLVWSRVGWKPPDFRSTKTRLALARLEGVRSPVDLSNPSRAQWSQDLVGAEAGAGRERHLLFQVRRPVENDGQRRRGHLADIRVDEEALTIGGDVIAEQVGGGYVLPPRVWKRGRDTSALNVGPPFTPAAINFPS
jgi:hypothetical protein